MNRSVALALGALGGGLAASAIAASGALVLASAVVAFALAIAALRLRRDWRPAGAAVSVGAGLILCRVLAGIVLAAPAGSPVDPAAPGATRHQAVVVSLGTPDGGLQRAVVELQPPEPAERIYVWLPRYPAVVPSDLISFDGRLEAPPADGGFAEYLARSGITATARSRTLERLGGDGSPLAALEGIRRAGAELLTRVLPEPQAGLATAMAIGLRDVVARDVSADFRTAGLSHVVAISGWHIAMLGAVVAALLGGLARRPRAVLVIMAIAAYSVLAGASPSILRAAVMASVVILARESGRRGTAATALSLTCVALLLVDPRTVTDIGFQLSAGATAGLLAWATPLRGWLAGRLPGRTPGWLLEALAVSLAAQAATLPLVLFHFGRLSLVAPLANLLIAPLVAPAMLITAICFVAGAAVALGVPALLVAPITLVGSLLIGAMVWIGHLTAGLPYASVDLPSPLNLAGAAASAAALALAARRRPRRNRVELPGARADAKPPRLSPRRLASLGGAVTMSLLIVVVAAARPDGRLHVTALDVGQGDAILLQGPTGGRMLIDTGPDPDRLLTLLDARIPAWDRRLDLVVLTHPHEDHVAGLALLLGRYRVGGVVEPGMVGQGPGDAAYRREMADLGRTSRIVAAGDRLWLDGIAVHVNWPLPGRVPLRPVDSGKAVNNVSIVLDLRFGERRMLFTGDIEEEIDPQVLATGLVERLGGQLDVLKVAHHGSGTATTDTFVERLRPRVAIVSAGTGNPYGHPSPQTVARLEASGAELFRTDLDGNVAISTDGTSLVVAREGGRQPLPQPTRRPPPGLGWCPVPLSAAGRGRSYNRPDVDPFSARGRGHRRAPGAAGLAAAPLERGGRDRLVPVLCHGPPRCRARCRAGDGRGPAP